MAGIKAIGSKLELDTGTGETPTWTKIANLTSIGTIGLESEEIDTTTHDSEGDFKEFIAGTKDAGSVDLAGNIVTDEDLATIFALANSREIKKWRVTYPTGGSWGFSGYVASFKDTEKTVDGLIGFTSGIRVSGAPVYTPAG